MLVRYHRLPSCHQDSLSLSIKILSRSQPRLSLVVNQDQEPPNATPSALPPSPTSSPSSPPTPPSTSPTSPSSHAPSSPPSSSPHPPRSAPASPAVRSGAGYPTASATVPASRARLAAQCLSGATAARMGIRIRCPARRRGGCGSTLVWLCFRLLGWGGWRKRGFWSWWSGGTCWVCCCSLARRRACRGDRKVLWMRLFVSCLWEGQVRWVPDCEGWFGGERAAESKRVLGHVGDWSGG